MKVAILAMPINRDSIEKVGMIRDEVVEGQDNKMGNKVDRNTRF